MMRDRGEPIELAPVVTPGAEFRECVVGAYTRGTAEGELPADGATATSLIPPGTGAARDFGYVAPTMPVFMPERCVGCMECVTACPDTAILGKVLEQPTLERELAGVADAETRVRARRRFAKTAKYWDAAEKRGEAPGGFGIFVDPTKCKGCGECVEVCGVHAALEMQPKAPMWLGEERPDVAFYRALPETPARFAEGRTLIDMMLMDRSM